MLCSSVNYDTENTCTCRVRCRDRFPRRSEHWLDGEQVLPKIHFDRISRPCIV